jgi:hypothetical protein
MVIKPNHRPDLCLKAAEHVKHLDLNSDLNSSKPKFKS